MIFKQCKRSCLPGAGWPVVRSSMLLNAATLGVFTREAKECYLKFCLKSSSDLVFVICQELVDVMSAGLLEGLQRTSDE